MSRAFNFASGPAALPEPVLQRAKEEFLDWGSARASVMEVSHRGKEFIALAEKAERDLREILAVPSNYKVLFLQGGATQHFAQIPMNLANGKAADYLVTGHWGEKSVKEAAPYCTVQIVANSAGAKFMQLPPRTSWQLDANAAYFHYTPNETIAGVEIHEVPDVGTVPIVADMSSTILSRPLDVSKFGLIYAGAQKNIGPSGVVVLIIRDDLLERCPKSIPNIFNYAAHAKEGSMLNTPPTFAWYLAGLNFEWIQSEGGLTAIGERNRHKAALLYGYIDGSGYYSNPVEVAARSWMNVPFRLQDEALDDRFVKESEAAGLLALKGHRSVGGMRASIYNAMPLAGVEALIDFMKDFAKRHG
ncbi:MAG: 3-phosphoserine/phosphohydroxythreonine transaminase [Pseudomonadota bacterium]|nr:3-phosphoserine/phosphohydroxythreonine transaminase [Pseudomonadota bacterium]